MTEYVLTAIDTTQIQDYIFGSNQLKENLGGSELVEMATHRWVFEALPLRNNVTDTITGGLDENRTITVIDAEVIYAGGGNTVIIFKSMVLATEFARRLTLRVLREAPGLEIVVAHRPFVWEEEPALAQVVQETLSVDLARKKQNHAPSLPLLGLGVTSPCNSTGLVATDVIGAKDGKKLVSREISAKMQQRVQDVGQRRLTHKLERIQQGGWDIPFDFDDLGRTKGEDGYIAVVHADGNGMGKRVAAIAKRYNTPAQNRDYISAMRTFSQGLERAATVAMKSVVDLMADALVADKELAERHDRKFPLRPIVFGGDDVTFVCHGRYGLPLTVHYLRAFEEATKQETAFEQQTAFACAGVAIVKVHYPFARAYHLSEQLCKSAKQFVREQGSDGSALDWHIAMSGITGTLEAVREREYKLEQGRNLYLRPVLLEESARTWRTWPVFEQLLDEFVRENGEWFGRRNKVKALREALRAGPVAVEEFLRDYQLKRLPTQISIPFARYEKEGWAGDRCVYFDPIEIMDYYEDLATIAKVKKHK